MAYVAAKGGEEAIRAAEAFFHQQHAPITREAIDILQKSAPYLIDRLMGEASLYSPELAALALAQTGGDLSEAVLTLRAYRSTLPRIGYAELLDDSRLRALRRISAAFEDVPGGQVLGPSLDYSHRLLRLDALEACATPIEEAAPQAPTASPDQLPYLTSWQKKQGILRDTEEDTTPADQLPDLTREPLLIPAPRAHRLQALARADTGGVLSLGYANMRGYGGIHPTINELRLSKARVDMRHPETGALFSAGEIKVSQAEVVSTFTEHQAEGYLNLGFCATLGWNEVKTIAGSMLDMAMDLPQPHPSHTEEYVLYHTEIVESSGFCIHYKLPHYVTFASLLDNLRAVKEDPSQGRDAPPPDDTAPQTEKPQRDLASLINETGLPTKTSR